MEKFRSHRRIGAWGRRGWYYIEHSAFSQMRAYISLPAFVSPLYGHVSNPFVHLSSHNLYHLFSFGCCCCCCCRSHTRITANRCERCVPMRMPACSKSHAKEHTMRPSSIHISMVPLQCGEKWWGLRGRNQCCMPIVSEWHRVAVTKSVFASARVSVYVCTIEKERAQS